MRFLLEGNAFLLEGKLETFEGNVFLREGNGFLPFAGREGEGKLTPALSDQPSMIFSLGILLSGVIPSLPVPGRNNPHPGQPSQP